MSSRQRDVRSGDRRPFLVLAHHRAETLRRLVGAAFVVAVALAMARMFSSPAVLGLLVLSAGAGLWLLLRGLRQNVHAQVANGQLVVAAVDGGALPPRLAGPFPLTGATCTLRSSEDGRMLTLSTPRHGTLNLADGGTGDLARLTAALERAGVPISH